MELPPLPEHMNLTDLKLAIAPAQSARYALRNVVDRWDGEAASDAEAEQFAALLIECDALLQIVREGEGCMPC